MSHDHGMVMNPGEFFQPLVKHRLTLPSHSPAPKARVQNADPHQSALQPAARVQSEAETWAPTPLTTQLPSR